MIVVGWLLLGLVALCLGLVLVLVATPLHLRLEGEAGQTSRLVLDIRTLWGLSPRLRLVDTDRQREKKKKPKTKTKREKKARKHWSPPGGRQAMWRLAQGLPDLLRGEVAKIHLDTLELQGRFGTGDPADTGRLYGLLTPFIYGMPRQTVALAIAPDFNHRCLEGGGVIALHLTPIALTFPVIRLLWDVYVRPS